MNVFGFPSLKENLSAIISNSFLCLLSHYSSNIFYMYSGQKIKSRLRCANIYVISFYLYMSFHWWLKIWLCNLKCLGSLGLQWLPQVNCHSFQSFPLVEWQGEFWKTEEPPPKLCCPVCSPSSASSALWPCRECGFSWSLGVRAGGACHVTGVWLLC